MKDLTGKKVENLILELNNKEFEARSKATDTLATLGTTEIIDVLISLLRKDSPRLTREGACKALGKIGDKKATDPLIHTLKDEDESVRYHAVIALGKIGDKKAVNPLMNIVKQKDDPLVRSEAAKALGLIGDPSALKLLLSILKTEEDRFIKYHAITSLGQIGDQKVIKTLQKVAEESTDDRLLRRTLEAIEEIERINNKKEIVAG